MTVSAVVLTMLPSPAQAANYDIGGAVPGYAGFGYSDGEVAFPGLKKFTWIGEVIDVCPGDGKGMEVRIRVRYRNGTYSWENNVLQDLNGCGYRSNAGDWEYITYPFSYTESLNIDAVQVQLWATEEGTPVVLVDSSTWKTNPN